MRVSKRNEIIKRKKNLFKTNTVAPFMKINALDIVISIIQTIIVMKNVEEISIMHNQNLETMLLEN